MKHTISVTYSITSHVNIDHENELSIEVHNVSLDPKYRSWVVLLCNGVTRHYPITMKYEEIKKQALLDKKSINMGSKSCCNP